MPKPESRVVPIDSVSAQDPAMDGYSTRRMIKVLEKQGQIEPLQINRATNKTYEQDPWGDEIWYAAKALSWDTILVLYTDKWIEV
jgi:hypothetical protein